MNRHHELASGLLVLVFACGGTTAQAPSATTPGKADPAAPTPGAGVQQDAPATVPSMTATNSARSCGGPKLKIHFYNVSQALAALVELPDGRHILVDTGDSARRPGCGQVCSSAHKTLVDRLTADLGGRPIDLLWITHPHSDHIGGAADVIAHFAVKAYADNGRDLSVGEIREVREAAAAKGIPVRVIEPGHEDVGLESTDDVRITAIAPKSWLPGCAKDRNLCSILLRVDYCASSALFTGDAEKEEEALLDPHGTATLLQVGHHGSDTSSSAAFLAAVQPKYAVISAGGQGEGMNKTYCHPRASTVTTLTTALGGSGSKSIHAFDGQSSCKQGSDANWLDVPASDHLWATERDGDVVLTTTGDGVFLKE